MSDFQIRFFIILENYGDDNIKNSYAVLSLACCDFLRFSLIIVEPKKSPMADSPTTKMKAGSLTAHSREGNQL